MRCPSNGPTLDPSACLGADLTGGRLPVPAANEVNPVVVADLGDSKQIRWVVAEAADDHPNRAATDPCARNRTRTSSRALMASKPSWSTKPSSPGTAPLASRPAKESVGFVAQVSTYLELQVHLNSGSFAGRLHTDVDADDNDR